MSKELGLGKINKKIFQRIVEPYIPLEKDLELDGAIIELKGKTIIAHSPSIGVPIEALGFFAFHYSVSNVAVKFGKPNYVVTGIYLPLRTKEKELETISKSIGEEATKYGVTVVAGQTATYYGLEIPLITTTCIGESIRSIKEPRIGDLIAIIGKIGGEGAWLRDYSKGYVSDKWREFTPLPIILQLQEIPEVKMMHDISEGGLIGSLLELNEVFRMKIKLDSTKLIISEEWKITEDILRAPSYGVLIVIIEPQIKEKIKRKCDEFGLPCIFLDPLMEGTGLYVDDNLVEEQIRINLDKIYGTFLPEKSENE